MQPTEAPAGKRRRGRPATIDRQSIISAALRVAADEGAGAVTMSAVAQRLGVALPALYYHVRNIDELLTLVAEVLLREMDLPDPQLPWDRWLTAVSHELRHLLTEQPLLTRLPYLAVHPPFTADTLETALGVLTRAGFAPDYALLLFSQHVRIVVDLVHAEHAREHERRAGRGQLSEFRRIASSASGPTPILDEVLARFADLPDDVAGYDDLLFDWQLNLELAGWRAALAGDLPTDILGPPRR